MNVDNTASCKTQFQVLTLNAKDSASKKFSSLNIPSTNVRVPIEKRIIIQNLVGDEIFPVSCIPGMGRNV